MGLKPVVEVETWLGLVEEGLKRFDNDAETYIRPMYWAEEADLGRCAQTLKPPDGV